MIDQAIIDRGRRAEHLLTDETLKEALEFLATAAQDEWRNTRSADYDAREEAYRQVAAIDALKGQLTRWLQEAQVVANRHAKAEERAQRRPERRFGLV